MEERREASCRRMPMRIRAWGREPLSRREVRMVVESRRSGWVTWVV